MKLNVKQYLSPVAEVIDIQSESAILAGSPPIGLGGNAIDWVPEDGGDLEAN